MRVLWSTSALFASVHGLLLILDDFLQHLHLGVSLKYLPLNNMVFNLRVLPSLSLTDFLQGILGVWVKQDGALRRISKTKLMEDILKVLIKLFSLYDFVRVICEALSVLTSFAPLVKSIHLIWAWSEKTVWKSSLEVWPNSPENFSRQPLWSFRDFWVNRRVILLKGTYYAQVLIFFLGSTRIVFYAWNVL